MQADYTPVVLLQPAKVVRVLGSSALHCTALYCTDRRVHEKSEGREKE